MAPTRTDELERSRRRLALAVTLAVVVFVLVPAYAVVAYLNNRAAVAACGELMAFDPEFADSHEITFEPEFIGVTCEFDNGKRIHRAFWFL